MWGDSLIDVAIIRPSARKPMSSPMVALRQMVTAVDRAARYAASSSRSSGEPSFRCPLCGHTGRFLTRRADTGSRRWAECPRCGAMERHRLQAEVIHQAGLEGWLPPDGRCLQFAPDPISRLLATLFSEFSTGDLRSRRADRRLDLRSLPLPDASLDVVYASHVLEHVDDDERAISEVHRVLAPGGVAVLPVPLIAPRTVEYGEPNPYEDGHVRAPGPDYFDRYRAIFGSVLLVSSAEVDQEVQPWIYEDRSSFPTSACPQRPAMEGERHVDVVPLCRK